MLAATIVLAATAESTYVPLDSERWETVFVSRRQRVSADRDTAKGEFGQYDVWLRIDLAQPRKIRGRLAPFYLSRESVDCSTKHTYVWESVWYSRNGDALKSEERANSFTSVPDSEGEAITDKLCSFLNVLVNKRDYGAIAEYATAIEAGGDDDMRMARSLCFVSEDEGVLRAFGDAVQKRAATPRATDRKLDLLTRRKVDACKADMGAAIGRKGAYLFRLLPGRIVRVVFDTKESDPERVANWAIDTVMAHSY